MTITTILFDLDGTLVYTTPEHRQEVFYHTGRELGIQFSHEFIESIWFKGDRFKTIRDYCGDLDLRLFWNTYSKYDNATTRRPNTKTYDDISILEELKESGLTLAAVTGAHPDVAAMNVELIGDYFTEVVAANPVNKIKPKPHPEGIQLCLQRLGKQANEAILIGNGDEDIVAAQAAGVLDFWINRGVYPLPSDVEPSYSGTTLYDFLPIIRINS